MTHFTMTSSQCQDLIAGTSNKAAAQSASFGCLSLVIDCVLLFAIVHVLPADAARGQWELQLEAAGGLARGDWVRLTMSDPPRGSDSAGSLVSHLYQGPLRRALRPSMPGRRRQCRCSARPSSGAAAIASCS